jgi:4'-phosphopantetheinyl transferase EntD
MQIYSRTRDRRNFVVGRIALRALILDGHGSDSIQFGTYGKPYLNNGPAFNPSHSGTLVALAIGQREPIGVDVELIRGLEAEMMDAVCSVEEKDRIRAGIADRWLLSMLDKKRSDSQSNSLSIEFGNTLSKRGQSLRHNILLLSSVNNAHLS